MAVYIEQYYNRVRLHSALRYRPPEESAGGGTRQSMRRRDIHTTVLILVSQTRGSPHKSVLMKWTQPSSHMNLRRGKMGL